MCWVFALYWTVVDVSREDPLFKYVLIFLDDVVDFRLVPVRDLLLLGELEFGITKSGMLWRISSLFQMLWSWTPPTDKNISISFVDCQFWFWARPMWFMMKDGKTSMTMDLISDLNLGSLKGVLISMYIVLECIFYFLPHIIYKKRKLLMNIP